MVFVELVVGGAHQAAFCAWPVALIHSLKLNGQQMILNINWELVDVKCRPTQLLDFGLR